MVGEMLALDTEPRQRSVRLTPGDTGGTSRRNLIPDGTEWTVALIVLGALGFLTLLEVGGFKTVLAASISTR